MTLWIMSYGRLYWTKFVLDTCNGKWWSSLGRTWVFVCHREAWQYKNRETLEIANEMLNDALSDLLSRFCFWRAEVMVRI